MKRKTHSICALFGALFSAYLFLSFSFNPPNGLTGAPPGNTCASGNGGCHFGGGGTGSVVISGLPATITTNTSYPITVTVNRTNGTPVLGGFQMEALDAGNQNAGSMSGAGPSSHVETDGSGTYFEHFPAASFSGNSIDYTVTWTSPASGSGLITMYSAANLADGNNQTSGDAIVTTTASGMLMGGGGGAITVTVSGTNVSCFGGSNGTATANPTGGGGGPYTYAWSNGGTTQTIMNLPMGTYMVTVSNATGTPGTGSITITQPAEVTASITNQVNITCAIPIGSATAMGAGGSGSFTYAWSTGATGQTANLPAGTHTVTATDGSGCTGSTQVTILSNTTPPNAEAGPPASITCSNPAVTLNGAGSSSGAGFTYLWTASGGGNIISGATTLTPTVNAAGTYTLTVTNQNNGCTAADNTTVTGNLTLPIASAGADMTLTCANPQVQLNGTGSSSGANFTYAWSGPGIVSGGNSATPTVNAVGNYTLTVTNTSNGCTSTDQAAVTSNIVLPTASAGADMTLTCASPTVTLNGSGSSSGANFTFLWTTTGGNIVSGANTNMAVVNAAGTYTLTVTNTTNGCTSSDQAVVTQNTAMPTSSAGADMTLTCAVTQLQLNGSQSSSGANFTYLWTTSNGNIVSGANTATPTVNEPGTYCLLVTNTANGCSATDCASVSENTAPPTANAGSSMQLTCSVTSVTLDGSASSSGANFTYAWSGPGIVSGGSTTMPVVNAAGTYLLTVTNTTNGCTATASTSVTSNTAPPNADAGPGMALNCNATSVVLNGSGSSSGANFTYAWSGPGIVSGGNTTNPTVNVGGTYAILVTNTATGCTASDNTTVTQAPALSASIPLQNNATCSGANNGSLGAQGTGGNGSYSYAWSNSATTQTITNLAAGTYTVVITDADNCTASASATVSQPPALLANASSTGETSPGANDGTATAAPTGGTPAYSYAWNTTPAQTTQTITGLAPGNYTVTVTDANQCTAVETVTVASSACTGFGVSFTFSNPDCNGSSNGSATATPAGGAAPFSFLWSNGSMSATAMNLAAGTVTVSVTDANQCEITGNVTLSEPPALTLSVTQQTNVSCNGASTGSATVAAAGGTPGYTYAWSNGGSGATQSNLAAGTYTTTATDDNGCTSTISTSITQPPALAGSVTASGETAVNANDGTANAAISGGAPPYSYAWSNGASTSSISNLSPGMYCVTATDANGCTFTGCATVNQFGCGAISTVISGENVECHGGSDGSAMVMAVGFTDPVSFAWSNGGTGASIGNLEAGTYSVSVTDANGCSAVDHIEITEPPQLLAVLLSQTNLECAGGMSGAASANAEGGTPGYAFSWSNGATTSTITGLAAGTYGLVVSDANDCTASISVEITTLPDTEPPAVLVQNITLELGPSGTVLITPAQVDGGSTDNCGIAGMFLDHVEFTCADTGENNVILAVQDAAGNCAIATAVVTIVDVIPPSLTCPGNITTPPGECNAVVDYAMPVATDNCGPPFVFLFTGLPSGAVFPTGVTEVTWAADDGNGSTVFCTFTVTVNSNFSATATFTEPLCNSFEDGTATVTPAGGTPPYGYEWDDPLNQTTQTATGLAAGTYHPTVTDASGCITTVIVVVTEPDAILATADNVQEPTCGAENGSISVTVTGGQGDLTFTWFFNSTPFSNEEDIAGLTEGEYVLFATDETGCTVTDTFQLDCIMSAFDAELARRITVQPNPTSGKLLVRFDLPQSAEARLTLLDLTGRPAQPERRELLASRADLPFDLSQAAPGVYFLKIVVKDAVAVKRVVVSR